MESSHRQIEVATLYIEFKYYFTVIIILRSRNLVSASHLLTLSDEMEKQCVLTAKMTILS